ncbi:MAG TPA: valine--tRNA ligase, partial [Kiloniellaceae bacterium]|nr:valine--tRNA ligase [Kiloniellaceae bacterium]
MLEKTYRPNEVEAKLYARWEKSGAFAAHPASDKTPYTIMMPPANVTGSLHIGHALTFTIQDILIRYNRMRGRDALWQPGTDHAGIATQMVVERQLAEDGQTRHDLGRNEFLVRVWDWKAQSGGTISRQLRRLGASPDWQRERFTMDAGLSKAVLKVFVALHKKGLIYKDKRLVNWDPKLHTAISDLEVQQVDTKGRLWHFRYPVLDAAGKDVPGRFLVVATTRPETMLGDTAVAVHPEDPRYRDLVGKSVRLPLVDRPIPVVGDDYADPETGSGAVKITPAHDFNDFEVGRRHDLEMINIFDRNAHLNDAVPEAYRGLDRFAARDKVVAEMDALGLLDKTEDHFHKVPHGDRGGVPIEPWLTDQWYVDAATLAKPAVEAVEQGRSQFVPRQWENTYFEWMRNIQPWCISRQIWWGHQIPAWYGPDGTTFVEESEEAAAAAAEAHYGKAVKLERDPDVLDTWFSSALWPFSTLGWPDETPELARYYPGDVLVTGFDIIFFWVARMMMFGIEFMGEVPFKTIYIHGLVRDAQGQKMSKSKGNIMDPLEVIDDYGCDALRFTLAALSAPAGRDVKLSDSRVEGYRNFATKLWNAARFCEMNEAALVADFDPAAVRLPLNRWIVSALAKTGRELDEAFAAYRFNDVASVLYHFIWHTYCDWYLEFAKPVLTGDDAAAKAELQATMAWVLGQVLHLLSPLMPFITEELWGHLAGEGAEPLITGSWPRYGEGLLDAAASEEMDWVIHLISEIRTLRGEMNVPPAAKVPLLIKDAGPEIVRRVEGHRDLIGRLARLESLAFTA